VELAMLHKEIAAATGADPDYVERLEDDAAALQDIIEVDAKTRSEMGKRRRKLARKSRKHEKTRRRRRRR
jgi:hypothetical protein